MTWTGLVRAVVVGAAVLLLPGWAWTLALFPRGATRTVDLWERATLAVGLSVTVVAGGLFLAGYYLRMLLTPLNLALLVAVLTALPLAWRAWRTRRDTTTPGPPPR